MHTIHSKKTARKPTPPARPSAAQRLRCFVRLLPARTLRQLPALKNGSFYDRLFTPLVSLWLLLSRIDPQSQMRPPNCTARFPP